MDLLYVLDYRFYRTPDGATWTETTYPEAFWERYLTVFDRVHVISRTLSVNETGAGWRRVDGQRVTVHAIPYYLGPAQYLQQHRAVRQAMAQALDREGAVILRVPSQLATCAESVLLNKSRGKSRGFGVEVVGDPWESLAPGAVQHPLRSLFRRYYTRNQRRQCKSAVAASYVAGYLERRYPCPTGVPSTTCSDVYLPTEAFAEVIDEAFAEAFDDSFADSAPAEFTGQLLRIVTVASLDQVYKGIDILLDAMALCVAAGLDLRLSIVGSGRNRPALEARASQTDLAGRVTFCGQLPVGQAVRDVLRRANLFVLPSRTEGMPRALLEAMALGLPCLGTQVGGIPEVLDVEDTFAANDAPALAAKLREVSSDPQRLTAMSRRNRATALEFREELLQSRRAAFYQFLRDASAGPTAIPQPLAWWKRPLDLTGAVALGLLTMPVWLAAAALVRFTMGPPILFPQPRPGRAGRTFVVYKFRTMSEWTGTQESQPPDAVRLTRLGNWLRRFSIDELPQLWNVIKGDMSLVGPRPLLVEYLPLYTEEQRRRHQVNPGLTGWAQIHGRNGVSWPERFALDVWYVDHQSLWLDLRILFTSVSAVLRGGGITQAGHASMTPFSGARANQLPGNGAPGN